MKIKISKSCWEKAGKKAGWMKTSQDILDSLYQQYQMKQTEKPVYVSLYETERAYGGPEEGGRWYNANHIVSTKKFFDREDAEGFAEVLRNKIEAEGLNKEDLSSSRGFNKYPDPSGGDPSYEHSDTDIPIGFSGDARNYFVVVEDIAGENETKGRPHYE